MKEGAEMKVCSQCGLEKHESDFYSNGNSLRSNCKACHNAARGIGTDGTDGTGQAKPQKALPHSSDTTATVTYDVAFGTMREMVGECDCCGHIGIMFDAITATPHGSVTFASCNTCTLRISNGNLFITNFNDRLAAVRFVR